MIILSHPKIKLLTLHFIHADLALYTVTHFSMEKNTNMHNDSYPMKLELKAVHQSLTNDFTHMR